MPATSAYDRPPVVKLLGLEGLRFLSAFAVLIWHYQHFFYFGDRLNPNFSISDQPLYSVLFPLYHGGFYGVNIFWCISGYIFFWKYRESISRHEIGIRQFFLLRFSRLYPLHIVTLFIVAAIQSIYIYLTGSFFVYPYNDGYHFFLQLFFASSWGLQRGFSFNGPIWSISVEVLVYFLFFMSHRYLGRSIWTAIIAIALAGGAKLARVDSPIIDCLGFFYVGGLTCVMQQRLNGALHAAKAMAAAWAIVVVMPLTAILFGALTYPPVAYVFWLGFTPALLYVASTEMRFGSRAKAFFEAAGNMTYSSYLLHFPLQLAVAATCVYAGWVIPARSPAFLAVFLIVTLTLAYFAFELFEKPAQNYLRTKLRPRPLKPVGQDNSRAGTSDGAGDGT